MAYTVMADTQPLVDCMFVLCACTHTCIQASTRWLLTALGDCVGLNSVRLGSVGLSSVGASSAGLCAGLHLCSATVLAQVVLA